VAFFLQLELGPNPIHRIVLLDNRLVEFILAVNGLILMLSGSAIFVLTKVRGSAIKHFTEFEMATTVGAQGAITLDPRVERGIDEADREEIPQ